MKGQLFPFETLHSIVVLCQQVMWRRLVMESQSIW